MSDQKLKIGGHIYRAFPTPLYRETLKLDKTIINPILREMEFRRLPSDDGWSTPSNFILEEDLKPIKPLIQQQMDNFGYNHMKFKKSQTFEITNSWVMKHKEGDLAGMHWHSNSLFSGILYLQCDPKSGDLIFVNQQNWNNNIFSFDYEEDSPLNQDSIATTPGEGDIIIFPSKTYHMVTPSRSKDMRFCIAFNVWVRGEVGRSNAQVTL